MSKNEQVTAAEIESANSIDLAEFLKQHGEKLLKSGREYRLTSNHSITVRCNEWYDHAISQGGYPIAFVEQHYGLDFVSAVKFLVGSGVNCYGAAPKEDTLKHFKLPPKAPTMRRLFVYLIKERKLSQEVVQFFVHEHLLYESLENGGYHNAVFVGTDERGVPRHAHTRSLGGHFRCTVEGSQAKYSFHNIGKNGRLYVFESPIDLISYFCLHPCDLAEQSAVALCGTSGKSIFWLLETYPYLSTVTLCLDNDEAGSAATQRLKKALTEQGYTVEVKVPTGKDWNEDLQRAYHA